MATSQYGYAAVQAMAAATAAPQAPVTVAQGLEKLASAADGCERASRDIFLQAFTAAADETGRADATGGLMLSLVLDPDPNGYVQRLTDAYGMQLYVSSVKGTSRVTEGARAIVMAAAGRFPDARGATKRMAEGNPKELWLRTLEGIARGLMGDRGAAVAAFKSALASGNSMPRTFLERGAVLFRLQDLPAARVDAEAALKLNPACTRCKLLRAQAMALGEDATAQAEGLSELSRLSSLGLPAYWTAEALTAASVVEARAGHADAAEALAARLRDIKEFAPEAALASGLAAQAAHNNAAALLALDKACKTLPAGPFRVTALKALAAAAVAEGAHAQALEALKGLEAESGAGAEVAELASSALAAMKDVTGAREETLRAFALDPYSPARATAAGRPVRAGGPALSAKAQQMWQLLGGGAAQEAMAMADALAKADKKSPYAPWAKVLCQRVLDQAVPVGETASKEVIVHAVEAVARLGKDPPHAVFPVSARKDLLDALDEGERNVVQESLKLFAGDPDPSVAALAKEAINRGAAKVRKTAH
jgi:tetratricopeptide (TPR) repeat protein